MIDWQNHTATIHHYYSGWFYLDSSILEKKSLGQFEKLMSNGTNFDLNDDDHHNDNDDDNSIILSFLLNLSNVFLWPEKYFQLEKNVSRNLSNKNSKKKIIHFH